MKDTTSEALEKLSDALWKLAQALFSVLVSAVPLMIIWNWLMTAIFTLPAIGYGQAFGLLILTGLLFKTSNTNER